MSASRSRTVDGSVATVSNAGREAQITTFVRDKRRRGMVDGWTDVAPARHREAA